MKFRRISGALVALLVTLSAFGQDLHEELFAAARQADVAAVKALLDQGVDVNAKWRYDTTAAADGVRTRPPRSGQAAD